MTEWARARSLGKRDDAEPGIVRVFIDAGGSVIKHSGKGEPDLFVGIFEMTFPVEVKSGEKAKLTDDQVEWLGTWQGSPVQICRSEDEARHLVHVWRTAAAVQRERDRKVGIL